MSTHYDLPLQENNESFLGIFTLLDIEDVYHQIPNEKASKLIEENPSIGLGFSSWNELLRRELTSTNRGPLDFFCRLLDFLNRDPDFVRILFYKSKTYTEENYYKSKNFSRSYSEYLKSQWNLINRGLRTLKQSKPSLTNRFWVDFHYFYSRSIEILYLKRTRFEKLTQELTINFDGIFPVKKSTLVNDGIVIEIKTRRKPRVGKYLSVKKKGLYLNLNEVTEQGNDYEFISVGRHYSLHLENDSAQIKLIGNSDDTSKSFDYQDLNSIDKIILEIINAYVPNFNVITDRLGQVYGWEKPPINGFLSTAINYLIDIRKTILAKQLIELANSIPNTWRTINLEYYEDILNENDE